MTTTLAMLAPGLDKAFNEKVIIKSGDNSVGCMPAHKGAQHEKANQKIVTSPERKSVWNIDGHHQPGNYHTDVLFYVPATAYSTSW
jgi:hypothetical protein